MNQGIQMLRTRKEGGKAHAYLEFLSNMLTCIAVAAGGAYICHHPEFFWHKPVLTIVIGSLVYLAGSVGGSFAVFEFSDVLFGAWKRSKRILLILLPLMLFLAIACYIATWTAFTKAI